MPVAVEGKASNEWVVIEPGFYHLREALERR